MSNVHPVGEDFREDFLLCEMEIKMHTCRLNFRALARHLTLQCRFVELVGVGLKRQLNFLG